MMKRLIAEENPRRSRVRESLRTQARRYDRFDDFEQAYWLECSRGIWWIPTDNPEFSIGPREKSLAIKGQLYAWCSPMQALSGPNSRRLFVAELDLGELRVGVDYEPVFKDGRTSTSQIRILKPDFIRTIRKIPSDRALRVQRYQKGLWPVSREELLNEWAIARSPEEVSLGQRRRQRQSRQRRREDVDDKILSQSAIRKIKSKPSAAAMLNPNPDITIIKFNKNR